MVRMHSCRGLCQVFHPTPDNLRAIYDMLRAVTPYLGWKLPPGEKIEFHVMRDPNFFGDHIADRARPDKPQIIRVSMRKNRTLHGTMATVAHEMIHVYEHRLRIKSDHGPSFQRRADAVCKRLGFDRGTF